MSEERVLKPGELDETTANIVRQIRRIADAIEKHQAFVNGAHMVKPAIGPAVYSFEVTVHKLD